MESVSPTLSSHVLSFTFFLLFGQVPSAMLSIRNDSTLISDVVRTGKKNDPMMAISVAESSHEVSITHTESAIELYVHMKLRKGKEAMCVEKG